MLSQSFIRRETISRSNSLSNKNYTATKTFKASFVKEVKNPNTKCPK